MDAFILFSIGMLIVVVSIMFVVLVGVCQINKQHDTNLKEIRDKMLQIVNETKEGLILLNNKIDTVAKEIQSYRSIN